MDAKPLTIEELAGLRAVAERVKKNGRIFWATLSHESINATLDECVGPDDLLRLIAAAERSCRRPIADAPKDGTLIDVITINGERVPDVGFWRDHWRIPGGDEVDPLMTSGHGIGWHPIPGEGGV